MPEVKEFIKLKFGEKRAIESEAMLEFLTRGFEQKLQELYEEFQRGECSLGYLADQLGLSTWEISDLLEGRGLKTTNL